MLFQNVPWMPNLVQIWWLRRPWHMYFMCRDRIHSVLLRAAQNVKYLWAGFWKSFFWTCPASLLCIYIIQRLLRSQTCILWVFIKLLMQRLQKTYWLIHWAGSIPVSRGLFDVHWILDPINIDFCWGFFPIWVAWVWTLKNTYSWPRGVTCCCSVA